MALRAFTKKIFLRDRLLKTREFEAISSIKAFYRALERERCRADRSGMPFALVSFTARRHGTNSEFAAMLVRAICARMRTTDEAGWIDQRHIGVILYNTDRKGAGLFIKDLQKSFGTHDETLDCSVYIYPAETGASFEGDRQEGPKRAEHPARSRDADPWNPVDPKQRGAGGPDIANPQLFSNLSDPKDDPQGDIKLLLARKMPFWKRTLDIAGAATGILILSPAFLILSLLIKLVSPGPVFFKQVRLGYGGKEFLFYKFRTMKVNADPKVHQKYLASLINGRRDSDQPMAKLDNHNPQIIPFGKIMRKTYLDELPQLINVLRGEMSLVGPRPPIPYEVDEYLHWHNGRFDSVPGMTGLWQVSGKNRLSFKEMVRLDIHYTRNLSLLYDLKILMMTPMAILFEILESRQKPLSCCTEENKR